MIGRFKSESSRALRTAAAQNCGRMFAHLDKYAWKNCGFVNVCTYIYCETPGTYLFTMSSPFEHLRITMKANDADITYNLHPHLERTLDLFGSVGCVYFSRHYSDKFCSRQKHRRSETIKERGPHIYVWLWNPAAKKPSDCHGKPEVMLYQIDR